MFFGTLALILAAAGGAAQLGDPVAEAGKWALYKTTDALTDNTSCIILYKDDHHVQINGDGLMISYAGRGGIKGFYYRVGEEPVSKIQILQTWRPSTSDTLVIRNEKFMNYAIQAGRLRIRALTYLGNLVDTDIDFKGFVEGAAKFHGAGCT